MQLIRRCFLCSKENDYLEDSDTEYQSVSSGQHSASPPSPSQKKVARFGVSADCTLTSRNIETMYDIEEDLTMVAERAARSAAITVELLDTLFDMMDPEGPAPTYSYGNKPCTRAELE